MAHNRELLEHFGSFTTFARMVTAHLAISQVELDLLRGRSHLVILQNLENLLEVVLKPALPEQIYLNAHQAALTRAQERLDEVATLIPESQALN